jgi:adenosylcobyric acid synthase
MVEHHLPDEEGGTIRDVGPDDGIRIAIIRSPFGSNVDEFHLLPTAARVRWASTPADLDGVDLVILPGSKHVAADIAWMRSRGLDEAVLAAAADGRRVHGVCGGAMMLGRRIDDEARTESADTCVAGLGMLPHRTVMEPDKTVSPTSAMIDGLEVAGYEIRHGRLVGSDGHVVPAYSRSGNVSATTVHGLLEDPRLLASWFGRAVVDPLPSTFDLLADAVEEHLDTARLRRLVGL